MNKLIVSCTQLHTVHDKTLLAMIINRGGGGGWGGGGRFCLDGGVVATAT